MAFLEMIYLFGNLPPQLEPQCLCAWLVSENGNGAFASVLLKNALITKNQI